MNAPGTVTGRSALPVAVVTGADDDRDRATVIAPAHAGRRRGGRIVNVTIPDERTAADRPFTPGGPWNGSR
ncbi:hypothetical protein J5Y04_01995 [Kitasatospora sp. RG8]|uniref:hypothetical protein n=1 Tax=Kitasatospora sp. RG8 TaxID=2820815 RepID=UPI001ADEFCD4|nr:hypothetical protein [Kitasatospora sp. RG8]MBP0448323.1 hypothetical protein [Kitasatospora sp. RG8]